MAAASGSYNLNGSGSLTAFNEYVGYSGTGSFTQSGGTNSTANILFLGFNGRANGTYILSGSSVLATAGELVGLSGVGSFTQSGGITRVLSI